MQPTTEAWIDNTCVTFQSVIRQQALYNIIHNAGRLAYVCKCSEDAVRTTVGSMTLLSVATYNRTAQYLRIGPVAKE